MATSRPVDALAWSRADELRHPVDLMRIGLLGPATPKGTAAGANGKQAAAIREAIEFLLGDLECDQVIYLGPDDDGLGEVLDRWASELRNGDASEERFLEEAAALALEGAPKAIRGLLEADAWVARMERVRKLPPAPARAVEMLADRILLAVYDKSILDEEDIANAQLIVYGRSKEAQLRRFGPRYFLTPGPAGASKVAVLELEGDGNVSLAMFETSGVPVWRETMARRTNKVNVAG